MEPYRTVVVRGEAWRPPAHDGPARCVRRYSVHGLRWLSVGMLPNHFPPVSTVRQHFYDWRDNVKVLKPRKTAVSWAMMPESRSKGETPQRHRTTDLIVGLAVHGAATQDRDSAPVVLNSIRHTFPWLRHIFADGGYAGPKLRGALEKFGRWTLQIVKRSDVAKGFKVLPRRWVVERTLVWLGRCRRLAKDWERTIASAETWLLVAHIRRVTRLLATT